MQHKEELQAFFSEHGITYMEQAPLAPYTTFQIGGPATLLCCPKTIEQLSQVLTVCHTYRVRFYFLCYGSNVLFADEGFEGVVILLNKNAQELSQIQVQEQTITAFAAASLAQTCIAAQHAGLTGLEFAYGIPGGIGGALYMNAGAYGGEMKDVIERVEILDENMQRRCLTKQQLELSYRSSIFQRKPWCILSATFRLQEGDRDIIAQTMEDFMQRRKDKQPLEMPSAGSTFKRPQGAYASALIDQCNLRGFAVGGAKVSEKHCGFVVNQGGATCADVIALTEQICDIVKEKTGFVLEREVRVVR